MKRIGDWFQTYTGKQVYLLDPRIDEICIEDIAHALAYQCRFNGHVREFYSIAQHSVFVAAQVRGAMKLPALLHDAAEAYLGDMVKPLKRFIPEYRVAEQRMAVCIAHKFGFNPIEFDDPAIKRADLVALATERRDLMTAPPVPWDIDEMDIQPSGPTLIPLIPKAAEQKFLEAWAFVS